MKGVLLKIFGVWLLSAATSAEAAEALRNFHELLASFKGTACDGATASDQKGALRQGTSLVIGFGDVFYVSLQVETFWNSTAAAVPGEVDAKAGSKWTICAGNYSDWCANFEVEDESIFSGATLTPPQNRSFNMSSHFLSPTLELHSGHYGLPNTAAAKITLAFPTFWDFKSGSGDHPTPIPENINFYHHWIATYGTGPFQFDKAARQSSGASSQSSGAGNATQPQRRPQNEVKGQRSHVIENSGLLLRGAQRFLGGIKHVHGLSGLFDLLRDPQSNDNYLHKGIQMSLNMFTTGDKLFYVELNVNTRLTVEPSGGTTGWIFAGDSVKDSGNRSQWVTHPTWGMDALEEAFEFARIELPDPKSHITPWIEIYSSKMMGASWKVLFPLWYDYTTNPPKKIPGRMDFFDDFVSKHGYFFALSAKSQVADAAEPLVFA